MGHLRFKSIFDALGIVSAFACIFMLALTPKVLAQSLPYAGQISAEDVYQKPDDHDLNLRYAKQEIRRGEMINAASALERMLYANPNWHSSRLLYAAVLYRLDDQQAALRELSLLKGRELNQHQEETYQRYLIEFQKPIVTSSDPVTSSQPNTSFRQYSEDKVRGDLTIGFRVDDNAGNALTDEGFGFDNRGDVSLNFQGRMRISKALSADGALKARAAIGGQMRRHETFSQADYDVVDLQVGVSSSPEGKGRMSMDLDVRQINISGEKYLDQIGPRITFSQTLSDKTRATFSVAAYSQNYDTLQNAIREDDRDGWKTRLQAGIQTNLNPSQKLSLAVGYDTKSAEIRPFVYTGTQALLGFEHKFKNNNYLKTRISARQLNYAGSLVPSVKKRKDSRLFVRQAFGIPANKIISNPIFEDTSLEFGMNYNERFSNIDRSDYNNFGVDTRLKFNF